MHTAAVLESMAEWRTEKRAHFLHFDHARPDLCSPCVMQSLLSHRMEVFFVEAQAGLNTLCALSQIR